MMITTAKPVVLAAACLVFGANGLAETLKPERGTLADGVGKYDVVWTSHSKVASGSMPTGNGDIGLNVWTEENGDLLMYLDKTDAFDEHGRLLKLGRLRVHFSGEPFATGKSFRQELCLKDGSIRLSAGQGAQALNITVWVDANRPVVHVEAKSATPFTQSATVELWRTEKKPLTAQYAKHCVDGMSATEPAYEYPDTRVSDSSDFPNQAVWYHRNEVSVYPATTKLQGLEPLPATVAPDPLLHRTIGAVLSGDEFVVDATPSSRQVHQSGESASAVDATPSSRRRKESGGGAASTEGRARESGGGAASTEGRARESGGGAASTTSRTSDILGKLVTPKAQLETHLVVVALTAQAPSAMEWLSAFKETRTRAIAVPAAAARAANDAWWSAFWNRSDIRVSGGNPAETEAITLGWHLNRFVAACTARGGAPVKFNGAIFNVDGMDFKNRRNTAIGPDDRCWGAPFWFQNERHVYWPMMAAGDCEQCLPFFKMYRDALPLAMHRTKTYYGHEGAVFPETMMLWGTYLNSHYGWDRKGKEPGLTDNGWVRRYWQGGIELSVMMLTYYEHTQDEAFARDTLLPVVSEVVSFYDHHYKRDEKGKIRFDPAQALESIWIAVNPTPEIAGLRLCVGKLLALPESLTTGEQRKTWRRIQGELPEIPLTMKGQTQVIAHAESTRGPRANVENVNLYAVWPYMQHGTTAGNLKLAQDSFNLRDLQFKVNACWHSDILFAACAGNANGARHMLAQRFLLHGGFRFPTFYSNGDWVPDLDNGGVCQNTIQSMLMQCLDRKIVLLPAWPKTWNASFKLHAPYGTTVEGIVKNGKMDSLKVTPEFRRKDVEILPAQ